MIFDQAVDKEVSDAYICFVMPIRVVIFEDIRLIREYLKTIVSSSSAFTMVAAFPHAKNILENVEATRPDVILMDIHMPVLSGIEATRIVKEVFPEVQILIQSVLEDEDHLFNAIRAGASGYLLKKSPEGKVTEAIQEVFDGGAPFSPSIAKKILNFLKSSDENQVASDYNLSVREIEILKRLVEGMSYKMIADACFISIDTVKSHIKSIYVKLHVNSSSQAVGIAIRNKMV